MPKFQPRPHLQSNIRRKLAMENDDTVDILRARAVAGALRVARPPDYLVNHEGREAWYECVRQLAVVVCDPDHMSLFRFYDLCGVPK